MIASNFFYKSWGGQGNRFEWNIPPYFAEASTPITVTAYFTRSRVVIRIAFPGREKHTIGRPHLRQRAREQ